MPAARVSRVAVIRRGWSQVRRQVLRSPRFLLVTLVALTALITLGTISSPEWVPTAAFVLVLVIGGYLLRPRQLSVLYVVVVT